VVVLRCQNTLADFPELFQVWFDNIVNEGTLAVSYVHFILIAEHGYRYFHVSFQVSLSKKLSGKQIGPLLADLPLSTGVCDVSQMQCLAKQEDLIRQLHVFFENLRVGLAGGVSY
jgi:hypothetical protein